MITLAIYFIVAMTVWDINWLPMLGDADGLIRFASAICFVVMIIFDFIDIKNWWDRR